MSAGETPADYIARVRLAMDPTKFAHTLRLRELLAAWLEGGAFDRPRDFRATRVATLPRVDVNQPIGGTVTTTPPRDAKVIAWCIELLESERLVAHEIRLDHDDALAHALTQVGAE